MQWALYWNVFFIIGSLIRKWKEIFGQNSKSWFVYFTETVKNCSGNELKTIHYVQTWPIIWVEVTHFCNPVSNLTFWKTEYLIAQLRAWIWQKVIRLKTVWFSSPSRKNKDFFIFTTSYFGWLTQNSPLNKLWRLGAEILVDENSNNCQKTGIFNDFFYYFWRFFEGSSILAQF